MAQISISEDALRDLIKQAVADALGEQRDLLHDVVQDVMEEVALAAAIREGQTTERVSRDDVFDALDEAA